MAAVRMAAVRMAAVRMAAVRMAAVRMAAAGRACRVSARKYGSPTWIRTTNLPINSRALYR